MLRMAMTPAHALPIRRKVRTSTPWVPLAVVTPARDAVSVKGTVDIGVLPELCHPAGPDREHMSGPVAARFTTPECAVGPNDADHRVGAGLADVLHFEGQVTPTLADPLKELSNPVFAVELATLRQHGRRSPVDIVVEHANDRGDVAPTECRVCGFDELCVGSHGPLTSPS